MKTFEDLRIWQESMALAVEVYKLLQHCKDFGLKDQMQRAVISIPSNIAEGAERDSQKEFIRFLRISKGSLGELRTQLRLAIDIGILPQKETEELLANCIKISKMLQKFINFRLKSTPPPTN
jgi:four helix bundle protein